MSLRRTVVLGSSIQTLEEYELFCHGRLATPYPVYHRLRLEDPVHWCEPLHSWILTRYEDVSRALRDARLASGRADFFVSQVPGPLQAELAPLSRHLSKWVVFADPPDHTRLRTLISKAFTPKVVQGLQTRIQQLADLLIDEIQDQQQMDLISDFAYRLPATVISELLGIPPQTQADFRQWNEDI